MGAVEVFVEHVTLDPVLGAPVVVLSEKGGERSIPIWVGQTEAAAIVSELRQVPMTRPSSHDLMRELILRLRGEVSHVTVTDACSGTYYAVVSLLCREGAVEVDARPSDAIALALRAKASIFVESELLNMATVVQALGGRDDVGEELSSSLFDAPTALCEGYLEDLPDEDFGKWKM